MLVNVAFIGFGNVGRALGELILQKQAALRAGYGLQLRVTGISTGSRGHAIDPSGINLRTALDAARYGTLSGIHQGTPIRDTWHFMAECPAELIFESIPTNPENGQPALAYLFSLLERGIHVVSANKGPVAFGYRDLQHKAVERGVGYFFESSVMDGAPVFSAAREGLPALDIRRISGIFNSTTNYILTRMEQDGLRFEKAVRAAQRLGIAETDPALDIDGWDAAIKTVILANVLMGGDLRPADVERTGIRGITLDEIDAASAAGERIRLICQAERQRDGGIAARVCPERIPAGSILGSIAGTTSLLDIESDVLPRFTLIEHDPGPMTTAYGMLADMINILRGRHITSLQELKRTT